MRGAIIDLGTNTFNLLVFDISIGYQIIVNQKIAVKLGEGGIENKQITPASLQRAIDALLIFKNICYENHVKSIKAFGTSAIRNADNKEEFLRRIKHDIGIDIEVIDGNREAELIYKGVKLGVALYNTKSLIIDIGGGSTEFIIANNKGIFWKQSFEIGAARLLEIIKPSNPIDFEEIEKTNQCIQVALQPLFQECKNHEITELIGSSGSFDTLAEIIGYRNNNPIDLSLITDYTFDLNDFEEVGKLLVASTFEERINTKGIIPIRAEMLVISTILTQFIVEKIGINKMRLSTYALKEGVLCEMLSTQ
jgi:exopolyphosphatase/guanosine-5'-triphosphate,3'-diphosphate pyrophosphatase